MPGLDPEKVACWYLRLNGFLQIENFVVHPRARGGARTDADLLGVRFPHRVERLYDDPDDIMQDDVDGLRLSQDRIDVVIAEVKTGQCALNGPWTDPERQNVHRVLAAIGCLPEGRIGDAAKSIYRHGFYDDGNGVPRVRLVAIGRERDEELQARYPQVPQVAWSDLLGFIFDRFDGYRRQKAQTEQWDRTGALLKGMATRSRKGREAFLDWATLAMGVAQQREQRRLGVIELNGRTPDVWLRAFWGFAPWEDGYVGWTREAHRDRILREATQGDLALIYGADSEETEANDRRQILGFLQLDLQPIHDVDKCAEIGRQRKIDRGWTERWTYAVPVRRAWRCDRCIELKQMVSTTQTPNRARIIASRGEMVTSEERDAVLQLPVTEVDVWGEPRVGGSGVSSRPLREVFEPQKGLTPTFGKHEVERSDGEHYLYMIKYHGDAAAFLGRQPADVRKKALIKVGCTNNPERRILELNAGIPPAAAKRWGHWLQPMACTRAR